MKTHYKIVLLGTLLIALSGCNTESPNLPVGYTLPPMPDATENSKTIAGIDSNTNGVRDDVEIYIYSNYSKPEEQKALMQYANAKQLLLANVKTKEDVVVYSDAIDSAIQCEMKVFNNSIRSLKELDSQTINTTSRVSQEHHIEKLMSKVVLEMNFKANPCE
ncbi:MAG: hypothetical protein WCW84_13175 [Sulfurimonas sp.]|jgi:hypothetical protein